MSDQKKKVRLSDIAERLGISTVTVSKAIADKEGVGEDLRNQIKQLAEEMGYKIKKTADNNKNGKITGNIGILIPRRYFSKEVSFYWHLFNFLSTELLNRNYYSIMELVSTEDEQSLTIPRIIKDKKVDGVIILGQVSSAYIEAIDSNFKNFVLLDFYTNEMHYDCVANDDYYCSYMLTSYVINQGHKKLRFVGNFDSTTSIKDRFMGFQKAMLENNLSANVKDIIDDRDSEGKITNIQLPQDDMPTAFICNCDLTASYVIEELTALGYKVPDDISVTGYDNYLAPDKISIPLTTVYIKPEDTASMTADLIIKKINNQPYIHGRHLVSGRIVVRDSVKKLN